MTKEVDKKFFNLTLKTEILTKVNSIQLAYKEKEEPSGEKPKKKGFFSFIPQDGLKTSLVKKMKLEQIELTVSQYDLGKMTIEPQKREETKSSSNKKSKKKDEVKNNSELENKGSSIYY